MPRSPHCGLLNGSPNPRSAAGISLSTEPAAIWLRSPRQSNGTTWRIEIPSLRAGMTGTGMGRTEKVAWELQAIRPWPRFDRW